jgi:hypothetical protein
LPKYEKELGIPKPSTVKRIDPAPQPHKKAKRSKKEYPPCWNVRHSGWGYWLDAHKVRPAIPYYWGWDTKEDRPNQKDLTEYLAWYAKHHPHTANLPVRFISCQPIECGREIIPN